MIQVKVTRAGKNPLVKNYEDPVTVLDVLTDCDINPNDHTVILNGEEVDVHSELSENDRIVAASDADNPTIKQDANISTAGKDDGG